MSRGTLTVLYCTLHTCMYVYVVHKAFPHSAREDAREELCYTLLMRAKSLKHLTRFFIDSSCALANQCRSHTPYTCTLYLASDTKWHVDSNYICQILYVSAMNESISGVTSTKWHVHVYTCIYYIHVHNYDSKCIIYVWLRIYMHTCMPNAMNGECQ